MPAAFVLFPKDGTQLLSLRPTEVSPTSCITEDPKRPDYIERCQKDVNQCPEVRDPACNSEREAEISPSCCLLSLCNLKPATATLAIQWGIQPA